MVLSTRFRWLWRGASENAAKFSLFFRSSACLLPPPIFFFGHEATFCVWRSFFFVLFSLLFQSLYGRRCGWKETFFSLWKRKFGTLSSNSIRVCFILFFFRCGDRHWLSKAFNFALRRGNFSFPHSTKKAFCGLGSGGLLFLLALSIKDSLSSSSPSRRRYHLPIKPANKILCHRFLSLLHLLHTKGLRHGDRCSALLVAKSGEENSSSSPVLLINYRTPSRALRFTANSTINDVEIEKQMIGRLRQALRLFKDRSSSSADLKNHYTAPRLRIHKNCFFGAAAGCSCWSIKVTST